MSSRFEQAITAGVLAGAIALAGCASSGGGGGNGGDGEPDAEFLGGRTISDTEIELRFSAPVTLGDAAAAAGLFAITGNQLNFGVNSFDIDTPAPLVGRNVTATIISDTCNDNCIIQASAYYSFTAGSLAVPDVQGVAADDDRIILTLAAAIPESADNGTGMLRLTYTGAADGIKDADGDALPDISLGIEERGNVADTVSVEPERPILIGARTIDSNHVELIFNEPLVLLDPDPPLTSFAITSNNALRLNSGVGFLPDSTSNEGADWAAFNLGFAWISYSDTNALWITSSGTSLVASPETITAFEAPAETPERLVLTLGGAIPADADGGTGRLRLYFNSPDGIEDADGMTLQRTGFGPLHRGNVKDTID